jgi:hypothetical protein
LQVYVDAVLDATGSAAAVATVANAAPVQMANLCGDGPFNGQLDDVRYYNGALAASQIQADMNAAIGGGGGGGGGGTSTLRAAYSFDASSTAAADQSGRNNTLVLTNTTWTAQGHTNGALQFNGTSSRAELAAPAGDLAFTTVMTVTAWVNPTSLPTGWHAIVSRQIGAGSADSFWLGHNGTTVYFGSVSTSLSAGAWTHLAFVKNGSTEQIYKNGVLAASTANGVAAFATDANEVGIGAGNNGNPSWGEFFNGRIDDLRFYAEARTAAQIQNDMNSAVSGAAATDATPPTISNVAASPTSSGATITWTTDEASTSQIDIGTTTSYGTTSPLDSTLVTSHGVIVSNLSPNTLYHYRVRSSDALQNTQTSGDNTFTTSTAAGATLVVGYAFEETGGNTAVDAAGGDNPGTLVGGVTRTAGAPFGNALSFDGVDDGVTVADAAVLNPGTGAFTASLWVNTASATFQRIIGKRVNCQAPDGFWDLLLFPSGVIAGEVGDAASGTYIGITGTHVVNDGKWHYLTIMRNGTTLQLFIDAVLEVSGTAATGATIVNPAGIQIGNLCGDGPVAGQLDEVRYYNGALTVSQLQTDMANPVR